MAINNIAFIGLGVMGYPMAGHLAKNGYDVTVHNRTHSKAEVWQREYGGAMANSPANAARNCDVVVICVGDDSDLRKVVFAEDGILGVLQPGAIIIDHTTVSADIAQEIYTNANAKGVGFCDAPVSGGEVSAKNGTLSAMVGGDKDIFSTILPILQCYARSINLMGPAGSGQLTKMVNQICISATLQGIAEAIQFGLNANLDIEKVLSVLAGGAAQSWQLENRGSWMLNEQYRSGGFAVDLIEKDLALCVNQAVKTNSSLPITQTIHGYFEQLQRMGKGQWDFSSLIELLGERQ